MQLCGSRSGGDWQYNDISVTAHRDIRKWPDWNDSKIARKRFVTFDFCITKNLINILGFSFTRIDATENETLFETVWDDAVASENEAEFDLKRIDTK